MHKVLIFACCAVSISVASSKHSNVSVTVITPLIKNETLYKTTLEKVVAKILNKTKAFVQSKKNTANVDLKSYDAEKHINVSHSEYKHNLKEKHTVQKDKNATSVEDKHHSKDNSLPFLHKLHRRITRSKDAVWATITLTFICVLLVLAVAQSRMWKDHYYIESQGVPLPNFNERVLFKDVMDRRMKSLKQFFKKKSKKENVTELESLLPLSEWDT